MNKVYKHVTNAAGGLDDWLDTIEREFNLAVEIATDTIDLKEVDVVFVNAPGLAIPELGVGGFCPGPNNVYINLNPAFAIAENEMASQLLHELYHAMRERVVKNYRDTLGADMVNEGLTCLYEEEQLRKEPPIYVQVELPNDIKQLAKSSFNDKKFDHSKWFFGGEGVPRWFGYAYGYELSKAYGSRNNLSAAEMLQTEASEILKMA